MVLSGNPMDISDCVRFANENPVAYVATVEGIQPRVRALNLWFADKTGFYFHTIAHKNVVAQVRMNPNAEVCFTAPPRPPNPVEMMRVTGSFDTAQDTFLRRKLIEDRPFLMRMGITGPDDPNLLILCIPHGEVKIWRMENFLMGKESAIITF